MLSSREFQSGLTKRALAMLIGTVFLLNATGCGTIFHGTHQTVPVSVTPSGAEVSFYQWSGEVVGGPQTSPGEASVHRPKWHQPYLVRASKEGYCPRYWLTTASNTGGSWSYLWMMFVPALGPIIVGLTLALIDSSTGGCCAVEPESFDAALAEGATCTQ